MEASTSREHCWEGPVSFVPSPARGAITPPTRDSLGPGAYHTLHPSVTCTQKLGGLWEAQAKARDWDLTLEGAQGAPPQATPPAEGPWEAPTLAAEGHEGLKARREAAEGRLGVQWPWDLARFRGRRPAARCPQIPAGGRTAWVSRPVAT